MGHSYPIFLSLEGRRCLVVGLGAVGCRKLASLLKANVGQVLALDLLPGTELPPEARALLNDERVIYEMRPWQERDIAKCLLVFACCGDKNENNRLAAACRTLGILCNDVTDPEQGSFIVPALACSGPIRAALSTGGQSPLLARRWRGELEDWLGPRARLAWLLGRLRQPVLALGWPHSRNRELFAAIANDPMAAMLTGSDLSGAEQWLRRLLPEVLHKDLQQIFVEYAHAFS